MNRLFVTALVVFPWLTLTAAAQEYKAEKFEGPPPADALSPEIAATIGKTGCKVTRGTSVLCEIWPCKEWSLGGGKTDDVILYPFTPGQLIGVIRLPRKITDFREQEVASGVYTLRYGQQPVDGAHVGTSPTRDFLLLLPADQDKSPGVIDDYKKLTKTSAASAGTSHPAILHMLKAPAEGEFLELRHNEEKDWWILRFASMARAGAGKISVRVEVVIVGHAAE
ncbi:MAG TPA: hypothetical protein VFB96_06430 [Pirellulaceae bacterium]|jgi:hypothetical protein|nr:hypothetical protein [Pirellulaceae bacterium]